MGKRSKFANLFTVKDDIWTCTLCSRFSKSINTQKQGTNSLSHHLQSKHAEQYKEFTSATTNALGKPTPAKKPKNDALQQLQINESFLRSTNDSKSKKIDEAILNYIASAAIPLSTVDDLEFRKLLNLLDPRYHLRGKKFFGSEQLNAVYAKAKEKIEKELKNVSQLSLAIDEWSNKAQSHSIIGITGHFVTETFERKHYVLGTHPIKGSHTAENMEKVVKEVLNSFNIDQSQIFMILRDGASSMVKLCKIMDQDSAHCLAHLLQLAVKDSLKEVGGFKQIIDKVKKFINKLRKSGQLQIAFQNAQELENLPLNMLQRGIEVRWSSLYIMLDSFYINKDAIKRLIDEKNDPAGTEVFLEFSRQEWKLIEEIRTSLAVFCDATTLIQSRKATISYAIPLNRTLQIYVNKNISQNIGNEKLNEALLKNLKLRFDKFKDERIYIIATILNPEFKLDEALFDKNLKEEYIQMIIDHVYEPEVSEESDQNIHQEIQPNRRSGFFAILDEHRIGNLEPLELKTKKQLLRAELVTYLDENVTEEDPAHYWKKNQDRFPQLTKLYRKCASASATTSEVERMFSLAGNVLTDLRQRLSPEKVKYLLFLHCNLPLL